MSEAPEDDDITAIENPLAAEDDAEDAGDDAKDSAAEGDDIAHWDEDHFDISLVILHLFEDPKYFQKMGPIKGAPFMLASAIIIWSINVLIIVSTFAFCIETYGRYSTDPHKNPEHWEDMDTMWLGVEVTCVLFFTVDLCVRFVGSLVAGHIDPNDKEKMMSFGDDKKHSYIELFFRDPMNYIDVLAIFPFYIKLIYEDFIDLRFIRVVRLVRILKSLPSFKHGNTIALISNIITDSAGALFIPVYFMSLSCIVLSSLVYYVEKSGSQSCIQMDGTRVDDWDTSQAKNPGCLTEYGCDCAGSVEHILKGDVAVSSEVFSSIPDTLWWCVTSFTTVGYGDLSPITLFGRLWACATMVTGVFFLAMPISIVGASFQRNWTSYSKTKDKNIEEEELKEAYNELLESTEGDKNPLQTLPLESIKNHPALVSLVRGRKEVDDENYNHVDIANDVIQQNFQKAKLRLQACKEQTDQSMLWGKAENLMGACKDEWDAVHKLLLQIELASDVPAE
jgi:hypothetical protein